MFAAKDARIKELEARVAELEMRLGAATTAAAAPTSPAPKRAGRKAADEGVPTDELTPRGLLKRKRRKQQQTRRGRASATEPKHTDHEPDCEHTEPAEPAKPAELVNSGVPLPRPLYILTGRAHLCHPLSYRRLISVAATEIIEGRCAELETALEDMALELTELEEEIAEKDREIERLMNAEKLPHGWQWDTDPESGQPRFWEESTGECFWFRPSFDGRNLDGVKDEVRGIVMEAVGRSAGHRSDAYFGVASGCGWDVPRVHSLAFTSELVDMFAQKLVAVPHRCGFPAPVCALSAARADLDTRRSLWNLLPEDFRWCAACDSGMAAAEARIARMPEDRRKRAYPRWQPDPPRRVS